MSQILKKRALSLLLALSVLVSAAATFRTAGSKAQAAEVLTWTQIDNAVKWATDLAENHATMWYSLDRNRSPYDVENIDKEGGNCTNFVVSAFWVSNNDLSYQEVKDSKWYQSAYHVNKNTVPPPRGAIVLYNGSAVDHVALSLGNGQVVQGGLKGGVQITDYHSPGGENYVGWTTYNNMSLPSLEPLTSPKQSFDKKIYIVGDTVTVNWTPSSVNSGIVCYWLELKIGDKLVLARSVDGTGSSCSFPVSEPGNYTLYICADGGSRQLPSTEGKFTVISNTKPTVTINPGGGTFTDKQTVTITANPTGSAVYYTTNGTQPTTSSTRYTGAITLSSSATIKAIAVSSPTLKSDVVSATFTKSHIHNWGVWQISQEPTLSKTGTATRYCKDNNYHSETKNIPNLSDSSVWQAGTAVESTCSKSGSQSYTSEYGTVTVELAKKAHTWGDWNYQAATEASPACMVRVCSKCNEMDYADIDHSQHTLIKHEKEEATCTSQGKKEFWSCSVCNLTFSDENGTIPVSQYDLVIPVGGHKWSDWTITQPATDSADGKETRTCSVCNISEERIIPKTSHTHTLVKHEKADAQCEADGTDEYWDCSECKRIFADENGNREYQSAPILPATGHSWSNWEVSKQPTMSDMGEETRSCTKCGKTDTRNIHALGHRHTIVKHEEVKPSCETEGCSEYWSCSGCSAIFSDENGTVEIETVPIIEATGHDWGEWEVTAPATDNNDGIETQKCRNNCGKTQTRSIPNLNHIHIMMKHEAIAPLCEAEGNEEYWTCAECGRMYSDENGENNIDSIPTLPATGHNWSEWKFITEPTLTTTGTVQRECKNNSNHKESVSVPILNDTEVWTAGMEKAPTPTEDGSREYTSEYGTVTIIIPKTGGSSSSGLPRPSVSGSSSFSNSESTFSSSSDSTVSENIENSDPSVTSDSESSNTTTSSTQSTTEDDSNMNLNVSTDDNSSDAQKGAVIKDVKIDGNIPKTELVTSADDLIEYILTSDEKQKIESGANVNIALNVTKANGSVKGNDMHAVESVITEHGMNFGIFLDITLFKTVDGEETQVFETAEPVTVKIDIPAEIYDANREYSIIRVHNGEAVLLPDLDSDAETVTFKTDRFSTYSLVYKNVESGLLTPDGGNNSREDNLSGTDNENPTTGVSGYIIPLLVCAAAVTFCVKKNKK